MRRIAIVVLGVVACTTPTSTPRREPSVAVVPRDEAPPTRTPTPTPNPDPTCVDPVRFGAVPADGRDDREALQRAIDEACGTGRRVCIDAGRFQVGRNPAPGRDGIPSLAVRCAGLIVEGVGPQTVIAMSGSGVRMGTPLPGDWRLIDIVGASDVVVRDLALDGSARVDTEEQTHLLQITGPASNVVVERLTLRLPELEAPADASACPAKMALPSSARCRCTGTQCTLAGFFGGGDCVRLLGEPNAPVRRVTLRDLVGVACDRSWVAVQRGVEDLLIERGTTHVVGDQAIDFEPTGGEAFGNRPIVKGVVMRDLVLHRGPRAQGGWTVSIGGSGRAVAEDIILERSKLSDGGIHVIDAHDVRLEGLDVTGALRSVVPVVLARKRIVNLSIVDSRIVRPSTAMPGFVLQMNHQSGQAPSDVSIFKSSIVQQTKFPIVNAESLSQLLIAASRLVYEGPQDTPVIAVIARGVISDAGGPWFLKVELAGAISKLVQHSGRTRGAPLEIGVHRR